MKLAGVLSADATGETLLPAARTTAKAALTEALKSGTLGIAAVPARDRYGRLTAQIFAKGEWVQGRLLRQGLVVADPDTVSAPCAPAMAEAEAAARTAHTGHWSDGGFAVRAPEDLDNRAGTFQIVEGAVVTAAIVNGRAYLNFGADYKKDFTVTVAPADMKAFRTAKVDLKKLAGHRVRVRGWIELFNGPEIELSQPAALEILDRPSEDRLAKDRSAKPHKT